MTEVVCGGIQQAVTFFLILNIRQTSTDEEVKLDSTTTIGDPCENNQDCFRGEYCKKHICEATQTELKKNILKVEESSNKDGGEARQLNPDPRATFKCLIGEKNCRPNEDCVVDTGKSEGKCELIKDCTDNDMDCHRCFECNTETKLCEKLKSGYKKCREKFKDTNDLSPDAKSGSRESRESKRSESSSSSEEEECSDFRRGHRNRGWWFCNEGRRDIKNLKKTLTYKWRCALDGRGKLLFCICTGLKEICTDRLTTDPDHLGFRRGQMMMRGQGFRRGPPFGMDYAISTNGSDYDGIPKAKNFSQVIVVRKQKSGNTTKEEVDGMNDEHKKVIGKPKSKEENISSENSEAQIEDNMIQKWSKRTKSNYSVKSEEDIEEKIDDGLNRKLVLDSLGSSDHHREISKEEKDPNRKLSEEEEDSNRKLSKRRSKKSSRSKQDCRKEKEISNKDGWTFCRYQEAFMFRNDLKVKCFLHRRREFVPWGREVINPDYVFCRYRPCVEDPLNFNLPGWMQRYRQRNLVCLCKCD